MAEQYGLIYVSADELLSNLAKAQPHICKIVSECRTKGSRVPDSITCSLIEQRLRQSDCMVNGWVLEGFPDSKTQSNLLTAMNVNPSMVVLFEQSITQSLERLGKRRIDQKTGCYYNLDLVRLRDRHLTQLLVEANNDPTLLGQLGLSNVPTEVLNTLMKNSPDAAKVSAEILSRLVPCEEDSPNIVGNRCNYWQEAASVLEEDFQGKTFILDVNNLEVS